jgi:imidazolonepropionase
MRADLIVHNASQLLTVASPNGPKRGAAMRDLGIIPDGAVAVCNGQIVDVGPSTLVLGRTSAGRLIDAGGRVVMPGFVDPHTHLVWAGERADEFEMRLAGASYLEIMAAGGGINATVRQTRAASRQELLVETRPRLRRLLAHGSTTIEIKTGYGLTVEDEVKQLEAIWCLQDEFAGTVIPTFLGAHAVPPEYQDHTEDYVNLVVQEMLPAVAQRVQSEQRDMPFCDVFCEDGAFSLDQSRQVLVAAKRLGFPLKIHVDEFQPLGGTRLAIELGATSADHLVCTPADEISLLARSDTIAVALPATPFGLGDCDFTPARALIDQGAAVALATDCNPGPAWCESMPLVIALACRYLRMTPAEAITAATLNAAYAIGLGQQVGSLEPGKQADVIILADRKPAFLGYRFGANPVRKVIVRGEVAIENTGP